MNFTEIALSVLYLLQEAAIPLNINQISDAFAAASDFTYIEASIAVSNLLDKKLIKKEETPLGELYEITIDGRISLSHMKTDIRGSIRKSLSEHVMNNFNKISLESNVSAHISPVDNGSYQVHLRAYDKDMSTTDIFIEARDEQDAKYIVSNWENHADDVIAAMYSVLLKDK